MHPSRRGRPTLHQVYNIATAELTGLFLTQKAIEEQASLDQFDSKTVLNLIQYSAQTTAGYVYRAGDGLGFQRERINT